MIGRLLIGLLAANSLGSQAIGQAMGPRHFEVTSVKPCKAPGGRGGNGNASSPGRLRENCITVMGLIRQAYVEYANGRQNILVSTPIEGGPAWIESAAYEIDAAAEGAPGVAMMKGPMLQALLEDRFQLKLRRETRQVPVYALTVARSGPKLQPSNPASCVPLDYSLPTPYPQFCGMPKRGDTGLHLIGATLADLCKPLSAPEISDRPVIDKTGIEGMFDIQLPGPGALSGPAASEYSFDAIKTAVEELGLNFERAKGPREFLVVDRVERPSEN